MNMIFFDLPEVRNALKPFTLTRPVADLRVGIFTLQEKWLKRWKGAHKTGDSPSYLTEAYLQDKFPLTIASEPVIINAAVCATQDVVEQTAALAPGQQLVHADGWMAARLTAEDTHSLARFLAKRGDYEREARDVQRLITDYTPVSSSTAVTFITHSWDIFHKNAEQIEQDYALVTYQRRSQPIGDPYTRLYGTEQIFVEEGATIRAAIINAESGPVYIGKNATIHENAVIKGPFALLEEAHVNIGGKIREGTTIGPYCKVGGEVKNTVFYANSNKGHEGFVGNSVIGEWCNFGADSNTSNLKNNYQFVRLWQYGSRSYEDTGLQFCGLMMGDHSKCSINTMFNTGTVVGVFANIVGVGFPSKFIPSFTWGAIQESPPYRFEKAIEVFERVLARKNTLLPATDSAILQHIFEQRNSELPK